VSGAADAEFYALLRQVAGAAVCAARPMDEGPGLRSDLLSPHTLSGDGGQQLVAAGTAFDGHQASCTKSGVRVE
jgi:hypothetical protein